jgi:predicted RND superfamily exporter protein
MKNHATTLTDAWIASLTRRAVNHPWVFLATALLVFATSCAIASRLEVLASPVHLLPTWDETAQRYNGAIARKGGSRSNVQIVVESPSAEKNRDFVDALEDRVQGLAGITRIDHGPEEERAFYQEHKWLFADERDLALVACELNKEREKATPGYVDLEDPCEEQITEEYGERPKPQADGQAGQAPKAKQNQDDDEHPLRKFEQEMQRRVAEIDRFPTGYYRNDDGTQYLLVLYSSQGGMGEFSSDALLVNLGRIVDELDPKQFHPQMQVSFGGKIPQGIAERNALVQDILWVSALAVSLILLSIVIFFRSPIVLLHIGLCMGTGTAIAFATAMLAYGHLNAATSFLVAIVAGNGINHGIVYLARYRERRAAGDDMEAALVEAAVAIRKGTWLAALAAAGAFCCLLLTSFRGFSEFGLIGGVGMIACWIATFTILPASVAAVERIRTRGRGGKAIEPPPTRLYGADLAAAASQKAPWVVLGVAGIFTILALVPLPSYLHDPWEYNFSKLSSKSSQTAGAGRASSKATKITKVRGSPVMFLADDISQALDLARQVEEADQRLGGNRFVERTQTVFDYLGGTPEQVTAKLEILAEIRDDIDALQKHLKGDDARIAKDWRPPERLRPLEPDDLPPMLAELFTEEDGRQGTRVYAYLSPGVSRSRADNMYAITNILESVKLPDGRIAPNASSTTVFTAIIRSLERDAPRAITAALVLVLVITLAVTRRVVPAAAVIGSLLAGILFTVGGAAWLGVRLNFLNFVAIPLTFGICVEYSVNLYERMRVHGGDVAAGIRSAGGPVFLCSLTTILGYGSLLVADNRALQSFGKYAIAGEISCILTALLVMPAALHALSRRGTVEAR